MITKEDRTLFAKAEEARKSAYAPYSGYEVGAAILAGGRIYSGANVENASFSASICAERVAALRALMAGDCRFDALAVASEDGSAPCGVCRQFLAEFAPKLRIVYGKGDRLEAKGLDELFPEPFELES